MTLIDAWSARRGANAALMSLAAIVAGSLLLTISAKVTVPFFPVPLSMQTFVAIGLGLALGPVRGTAAVALYLAQGAAGLPVFAGTPQQGIGLAYMFGPTGGYLLGFALAAFVAGHLARAGWDRTVPTAMAAALIAGAAVYVPGLLWLGSIIGFGEPLLVGGLYPFVPGDIAKALLAAIVFPAAWKWVEGKDVR
jgi:biotin transport system substrate-specific component